MTEPNETVTKQVDLAKSPFAPFLGTEPLVLELTLETRDGERTFTKDSLERMAVAVTERLKARGMPDGLISDVTERLNSAIANPAQAMRNGAAEMEREAQTSVSGKIAAAIKLLEDVDEEIKELCKKRALVTLAGKSAQTVARYGYHMGMAAGAIGSAQGELRCAREMFDHATTCACMSDDEPQPEPAAAPEAP